MNQENIYLLSLEEVGGCYEKVFSSLAETQKARVMKRLNPKDRMRSAFGLYLINAFTGPSPLVYLENGKPVKEDCFFSLSHSHDLVALFVSDDFCGVDVEESREVSQKLIDRCLSSEEKAEASCSFLEIWTRKEAFAKIRGEGMFRQPISDVPSCQGTFVYQGENFETRTFRFPENILSLSKKGTLNPISFYRIRSDGGRLSKERFRPF